jgi:Rrf2 family protein
VKLSGGVEWALHCCAVLSRSAGPVSSARLADLHGVSRTYLAKHLQALARAGLVQASEGRDGGYALTRDPAAITVLDVVEAIDGAQPAFRCTEIRQQGELALPPEECRAPCGIARLMADAERAWRRTLAATTVADLGASVDPDRLGRVLGRG